MLQCAYHQRDFLFVQSHAYSLPPPPKLLPGLYELLDGSGWRKPFAFQSAFFPRAVVELTDAVLAEPGDVLPELL